MITVDETALWVVTPEAGALPVSQALEGLNRDAYCEVAFLSLAVWLAIRWTQTGISAQEIVDLLQQTAPFNNPTLESETCAAIAGLARHGFILNKTSRGTLRNGTISQAGPVEDQTREKFSAANAAPRLLSADLGSSRTLEPGVLLNIRDRRCFVLTALALKVWSTIQARHDGVSRKELVSALEPHFAAARKELQGSVSNCVHDLVRERLVGETRESRLTSYVPSLLWSSEVRVLNLADQSSPHSGGDWPLIQPLGTFESYLERLFPQTIVSDTDWRAVRLREAIDNAPAKFGDCLRHVCGQFQLSLSSRQARRLFKRAAGTSMKDYARKNRLVLAAIELHHTDQAVKVIASNAGYRSYGGFWKAFYDLFLLTPVEFRTFWQRSKLPAWKQNEALC